MINILKKNVVRLKKKISVIFENLNYGKWN